MIQKTICLDPSGNFRSEGKGTTGWSLFVNGKLEDFGDVKSEDFQSQEGYWNAVGELVLEKADEVVCESFKLFAHKSAAQSWSELETPQLIGYLKMLCWYNDIPIHFQDPSKKVRVADDILVRMGVLELKKGRHYCLGKSTNLHQRDSIRHGIYWFRFGGGK